MEKASYSRRKKVRRTGFLKLDITAWAAMLVMSLAGAIAVYLYHFKNQEHQDVKLESGSEMVNGDSVIHFTADIETVIGRCKSMVSNQNSFVVFEHGTCVRLIEPVENHVESANASLKILASPHIAFSVKPLNNNDYLIVFNDYLFCWLFAKDIATLKDDLISNPSLEPHSRDPQSIKNLPSFEQRLGKFARLLMLEDAKNPAVKKIIRANPTTNDASSKLSAP